MAHVHTEIFSGPVVHWRATVLAGLIAGAVFLMFEMPAVALFLGMSPWAPPRMMAAIVLGQGVLPPPDTFDIGIVMTAMMLHFALSIAYAYIIALVVQSRSTGTTAGIGVIAGLVLYLVNFYGFTYVFPWFAMARNSVSVAGHVLFGLVAALSYRKLVRP
jgi:hypothetical protein